MGKKTLLLMCYAAFLMLCSNVTWGQHGVLLPEKLTEHVHDENCNHEEGDACCSSGLDHYLPPDPKLELIFQAAREKIYETAREISTKRGDISNPRPNFGDRDYIHDSIDVSVVFGAGESNIISGDRVIWPKTHVPPGTPDPADTPTTGFVGGDRDSALLIGSYYSKNAVIGFYDYEGQASGAVRGIRLYGNSGNGGLGVPPLGSAWPYGASDTWAGYNATGGVGMSGFRYWAIDTFITASDAMTLPSPVDATSYFFGLTNNYVTYISGSDIRGDAVMAKTDSAYDGTYVANYYVGAVLKPYYDADSAKYFIPVWNHVSMVRYSDPDPTNNWDSAVVTQKSFFFTVETADTIYTSTRNVIGKKDNEQSLLHTISGFYRDDTANVYTKFNNLLIEDTINYIRPTTVLLRDNNIFDSIVIRDVEWYAAFFAGKIDTTLVVGPFPAYNPGGCGHLSGWVGYLRDVASFDTIWTDHGATNYPDHMGTHASGRFVDAAVRILDNSDVCVTGSVMDSTTVKYSLPSLTSPWYNRDTTSAILVLPGFPKASGERSNFRLKIGGDAAMLHTQDSNYYLGLNPLQDELFYREATSPVSAGSPGEPFPTFQNEIYLSGRGVNNSTPWVDEVAGMKWDYVHPREPLTLTYDETIVSSLPKTQWVPFASTNASVYGVWGDYFGLTNIHTQDFDGVDTTNIIEIGPSTANQDYFKIYSGGMLKNFRSDCSINIGDLIIGTESSVWDPTNSAYFMTAPGFSLSRNPDTTLYIIYDGDGSGDNQDFVCGGIIFNYPGVDSINYAIEHAAGGGDLHIQSLGYIQFLDNDPSGFKTLDFTLIRDNEVKILSDQSYIVIQNALNFMNADSAHLTIWANGSDAGPRGDAPRDCESGSVELEKDVEIEYDGGLGKGLILIRSENDDVLMGRNFSFTNTVGAPESGELMVQAGQDIRIEETTTLTQDGPRSMLFEAHKTIAFGPFDATMGSTMENGDLTIKAGYGNGPGVFLPTADVSDMNIPLIWEPSWSCVTPGYNNRDAGQIDRSGGDIWFRGIVNINLTPEIADSVDVYIRAYNSIYVDADYQHTLSSTNKYNSGDYVDSTLTYAETGNYEAINSSAVLPTGNVVFNFSANDSVYFLLQAGNKLGNPCGATECLQPINLEFWHGNVLFGTGKEFTINHDGVGPTLISASRDIENQVDANFTFTYTNPELSDGDSVKVTAGRHIETHAPYWFDFSQALKSISNNIIMQAGHQQAGCDYLLCKAPELASNLAFNVAYTPLPGDPENIFAEGGNGHGSILLFDSLKFNYSGTGNILITALNGNIESDPYLHGSYNGGAPILFNVDTTEGIVRMEAIDIKLHDILEYNGFTANALKNGQFYMAAFDSILTRNISYTNLTDTGSVFITTDKYKLTNLPCGESDYTTDQRGIHQGHIVLGYASDCGNYNVNDRILFDFSTNPNTEGANLFIQAGYLGYYNNPVTGVNSGLLANRPADRGKGYGGNITFDFMKINMALGDGNNGGYAEISTPNGNIWGKDSIQYHGINGNLRIDAGLGSLEDTLHAVRWSGFTNQYGAGSEDMLNTKVPFCCDPGGEWRTGNIMLKGGSVDFINDVTGGGPGNGNVFFRTREGFIDIYDRFNATNMTGHLLIYAGITPASQKLNEWGDVSQRDFQYTPVVNSGSVYFGADDNIMLNYGYSNGYEPAYQYYTPNNLGYYDVTDTRAGLIGQSNNPFYSTFYKQSIDECYSIFNVNTNGYLWYKNYAPRRNSHLLYRGCAGAPGTGQSNTNCSPLTGECYTVDNGARPLTFNFNKTDAGADILSGGLAVVASNYIDMFTAFTFEGGSGSGIAPVPEMTTLKGERVDGYGLYIKSLFNGANPEKRRNTCFLCSEEDDYNWMEWPGVTFHDDARIHTQGQKSLLEAPIFEFFGHTELDAESDKVISNTKLTVKADSLIFHDSAIFAGPAVEMLPYTTDPAIRNASKASIMRYGVVNDDEGFEYYLAYGKAIQMPDRGTPVLEFGYQRCYEPPYAPTPAPNRYSRDGKEPTPMVGGDIIVAFKHDFALPIYNTIVANHARISFIDDLYDGIRGGEFVDTYIRTDLLRIRNKVEFYTDPDPMAYRLGTLRMTSNEQMPSVAATGIYPRHLHLEPGSELSIPSEDSLIVISTTTVGGYGEIHENVHVLANGIIAPGYASLMEHDCQTGFPQGRLSVHNLYMEKDAVMRVSMRFDPNNCDYNPDTKAYDLNCTRMDTLSVHDSIFFFGRIPLYVLIETKYIEPGCYLFLEYEDTDASVEYVQNLVLMTTRHNDLFLTLDKSERGRVYLCVTELETPIIQRYVLIHEVEGVKTDPVAEIYHYVPGHQDFVFTTTYSNKTALEVLATGYYSQKTTKLPATYVLDGTYEYRIRQVVEPYDVYFGGIDPDSGDVLNEGFLGKRVWAYRNTLFINVDKDDVVSIYNVTGVLCQKLDIPAGLQKLTLDRGVYMVTLKNGTVHKIIIN